MCCGAHAVRRNTAGQRSGSMLHQKTRASKRRSLHFSQISGTIPHLLLLCLLHVLRLRLLPLYRRAQEHGMHS